MAETVSIQVRKRTRSLLRRYSRSLKISYDEALRRLLGDLPEEELSPEEMKSFLDSLRNDRRIPASEVRSRLNL